MRILLDSDGVLGDFVCGARTWLEALHGRQVADEQVTDYNIMQSFGLPNEWPSFIDWLSRTRFCREMPVYDGAVAFVEGLRKFAEVVVVSSPFVGVDHWESDRRRWLEQHFGIRNEDLVFCKRKELVRGHLLIEDSLDNCEAFVGSSSFRDCIVIDRPWNRQRMKLPRALSYASALALVAEKVDVE